MVINYILLAVVSFITLVPTIKYWSIIISGEDFRSRHEIFIFTIFRFFSALCIIYYLHFFVKSLNIEPSYFIVLFCSQLIIFPTISFFLSFFNFLEWIWKLLQKVKNKFGHHIKSLRTPKIAVEFFKRYYTFSNNSATYNRLSNNWNRKVMIIFYLISGILTATDIAHSFLPSFIKKYTMCSSDLQLYSNFFIITQLPLLIPTFIDHKHK
jgi:hypothetical protein